MIRPDSIVVVNEKPRLKWVACHRGARGGEVIPLDASYILHGPLRGCWRKGKSVFKLCAFSFAIEFYVVIRVVVGDAEC